MPQASVQFSPSILLPILIFPALTEQPSAQRFPLHCWYGHDACQVGVVRPAHFTVRRFDRPRRFVLLSFRPQNPVTDPAPTPLFPAVLPLVETPADEAIFISARQLNAVLIKERALLIQAAHGDTSTVLTTTAEYDAYGTEEEKKWASKRIVLSGFSQGPSPRFLLLPPLRPSLAFDAANDRLTGSSTSQAVPCLFSSAWRTSTSWADLRCFRRFCP